MTEYQKKLRKTMDSYVHFVYKATRTFPKEELYGSVSQWRRSTLSIILNYIEGYARRRPAVQLNFYEIAYGSLQESKYLLSFSLKEKFIDQKNFAASTLLVDEIGAMLWSEIQNLQKSIKTT